jgi:ricin-type beta-trefoil lectin protein
MPIALAACALMVLSVPLAGSAQAVTASGQAKSPPSDVTDCAYDTSLLQYSYYEADGDKGLDWWARNSATSGHPVILEPVSGSSDLDCFKQFAYGNSAFEFELGITDLCLNIAGDSHAAGAWVILYPCTGSSNELFIPNPSGLGDDSESLGSQSTPGMCIDLDNGYNRGSILEQKPCKYGDVYQAWYPVSG